MLGNVMRAMRKLLLALSVLTRPRAASAQMSRISWRKASTSSKLR